MNRTNNMCNILCNNILCYLCGIQKVMLKIWLIWLIYSGVGTGGAGGQWSPQLQTKGGLAPLKLNESCTLSELDRCSN